MTENEAIRILGDTTLCTPLGQAAFVAIESMKKLQQYRAIGTIEECRESKERQRGKKPKSINKVDEDTIYMKCANCGLTTVLYSGMEPDYCPKCGQAIDWSEQVRKYGGKGLR